MDLPIAIDPDSPLPIYLQISLCLKEKIRTGLLPAGTKLPSTQALSQSLSVARSTVVKAYEDLLSQGYSETVSGGGTFVSQRFKSERTEEETADAVSMDLLLSRYAKELLELKDSGGSSVENQNLNFGAPAAEVLPFQSWKQVLSVECQSLDSQSPDWTPEALGLYRCRKAIAEFLCRSKGLNCSAEQVMIFAGCKESFPLASKLLLNRGDLAGIENPSYEDPRIHLQLSEVEIMPLDVDENGMIVSKLKLCRKHPKLVYVSPSQDPTGVILSLPRREELLDWAQEHSCLIWEEGWDSDYNYSPPQLPPLQALDKHGLVIYSYCFWKLLYPLVTIGVLVLPRRLAAVFEKSRQIADIQFSMLEQRALSRFIEEGYLERHLRKSKRSYELKRKALLESLLEEFRMNIIIPKQSAGLHLCIRLPSYKFESILLAAEQTKLPLISSAAYYMEQKTENEFLLPFTLFAQEVLQERVKDFARTLNSISAS